MKNLIMIQVIAAIFAISGRAQGFLNLNFESAYGLPGNPGSSGVSVPVTDALPDWSAYDGPNALADIYYVSNDFYGASTAVELEGGTLALTGSYSVYLFENGSISQTATVSDGAASLQFEATSPQDGMYVTLGGQTLSYSALYEGPDYTVYGANIPSDLDGQTETLTFGMQGIGQTLLDNVEFSTVSVPEPSECALIFLAAVLFGLCRHRKPSIGTDDYGKT